MKKDVVVMGLIIMIIGFVMWMYFPLGSRPIDEGIIEYGPFQIGGFFVFITGLGVLGYGIIAKRKN